MFTKQTINWLMEKIIRNQSTYNIIVSCSPIQNRTTKSTVIFCFTWMLQLLCNDAAFTVNIIMLITYLSVNAALLLGVECFYRDVLVLFFLMDLNTLNTDQKWRINFLFLLLYTSAPLKFGGKCNFYSAYCIYLITIVTINFAD